MPPFDVRASVYQISSSNSPSNEWQDLVISQLNSVAAERNTLVEHDSTHKGSVPAASSAEGEAAGTNTLSGSSELSSNTSHPHSRSDEDPDRPRVNKRPTLTLQPPSSLPTAGPSSSLLTPFSATGADRSDSDQKQLSERRQRRRVDPFERDSEHARRDSLTQNPKPHSPSSPSVSGRSRSPVQYAHPPLHPALLSSKASKSSLRGVIHGSLSPEAVDADADVESADEDREGSGEDELAVAVGQLSINEDEQVRYHGKASGLHLLGASEREDNRAEGGIWYDFMCAGEFSDMPLTLVYRRFPGARVWPPLPPTVRRSKKTNTEYDWLGYLPDIAEQEYLLEIFWVYVHPALPIIHKKLFMECFREM